jgi:hypothetical protein
MLNSFRKVFQKHAPKIETLRTILNQLNFNIAVFEKMDEKSGRVIAK